MQATRTVLISVSFQR